MAKSYCFLSVIRSNGLFFGTNVNAALVILELTGGKLEAYHVNEVLVMPTVREKIIDKVLELQLPYQFQMLCADPENIEWLENNDLWNTKINAAFMSQPARRGTFPILRSYQRDSDISIRQVDALTTPFENGKITFSQNIAQNTSLVKELKHIGQSFITDALAGAILVANDQRHLALFARQQANRPKTNWYGLRRWNDVD